jgi:hypothetical protein
MAVRTSPAGYGRLTPRALAPGKGGTGFDHRKHTGPRRTGVQAYRRMRSQVVPRRAPSQVVPRRARSQVVRTDGVRRVEAKRSVCSRVCECAGPREVPSGSGVRRGAKAGFTAGTERWWANRSAWTRSS